ncbi:M24 family metallopeptidase [Humitalea sp. 24SJ18S-53]|uniref:M24 family metallopeptidase n=1 Tax=Humitalea sp. 24SJ18S-53 TaxID=3422307 RepID=UPI003D664236
MSREPVLFNESRMRAMMDRRGLDLVILRGVENSRYVSEFLHNGGNLGYRPFCVFYFRDPAKKPAFVVPAVDLHLAMTLTWIEDVRAYAMAEFFTDIDTHFYVDFASAAKAILAERGVSGMKVGTEGDNLTSGFRTVLDGLLEGNTIEDISFEMEIVRMVKTPEEIRRLKLATEITVKAHASFRDAIKPGVSDLDLHKAACLRMLNEGATAVNFINTGAGPANAFAAHDPFPRGYVLQYGDFVKVDMGAQVMGYSADFVRSYFIGEASERQQEIWKRLNEVQLELGLWIKPGVTGGEIFDRGYAQISRYLNKFPREFFGHGIGLGSHEQPRMNAVNRTVVEPNSVLCVEFSYYHDGVRHHTEETFLIKDDGVDHWTAGCPTELIVAV